MKKLRATIQVFKRYGGMIRPYDIVIIVALIILSFSPLIVFSYQQKQQAQRAERVAKQRAKSAHNYTAVVSHNGTVLKRVNITTLKKTTHYVYRAKDGETNTITFEPKRVAITKANCSDQVCIRRGWIHKPGQTIVCLPHKVLVEIKSSTGHVKSGGNGLVTE